jgi:hypothetical protein
MTSLTLILPHADLRGGGKYCAAGGRAADSKSGVKMLGTFKSTISTDDNVLVRECALRGEMVRGEMWPTAAGRLGEEAPTAACKIPSSKLG